MKVFGEVKLPCEYFADGFPHDYMQHRIADYIAHELIDNDLIKFTEEYKQGYYIMRGEVEVDI